MTVDVRPARPDERDAIAAVHAAAWHETYPGLVPDTLLAGITPERQAEARRAFTEGAGGLGLRTFVATIDGEIVGFGDCGRWRGEPPSPGSTRPDGEFYALYLLRRAQGLNLGTRLMQAMARAMRADGMRSAGVWLLPANQAAARFYRRLGGIPAGERTELRMGAALPGAAYVFMDLAALG